jgi:hypothetical protein
MAGFIDIEYETLKQAIKEIESKRGICEILPSARFKWQYDRIIGGLTQVGNHMPRVYQPEECSQVAFDCLVCDRLGGRSTGTGAKNCRNCKPLKRRPLYPDRQATKTWQYKDATCYLVYHEELGHYCCYARFKQNPFTRGCHYQGFRAYIPVHGGITYAEKDSQGYVYGFDCAHAGDEDRPELKDIDWLTRHTERFCDMLLLARDYESRYKKLKSNKAKAKVIDEYREKVNASEEIGFGAMINVLTGEL